MRVVWVCYNSNDKEVFRIVCCCYVAKSYNGVASTVTCENFVWKNDLNFDIIKFMIAINHEILPFTKYWC